MFSVVGGLKGSSSTFAIVHACQNPAHFHHHFCYDCGEIGGVETQQMGNGFPVCGLEYLILFFEEGSQIFSRFGALSFLRCSGAISNQQHLRLSRAFQSRRRLRSRSL